MTLESTYGSFLTSFNSFGHTGARRCFCSSLSKSNTHRGDLKYVLSNNIRWHVPYKRLNLPVMSEMVLHRFSLTIFLTFSTFSSVRSAERRPERHHLLQFSPRLNKENHSQICVLSMAMSPTAFFSALQMQLSQV